MLVTKNILCLNCFVLRLLDTRPFFSRRVTLLLSWYIWALLILWPWASIKYVTRTIFYPYSRGKKVQKRDKNANLKLLGNKRTMRRPIFFVGSSIELRTVLNHIDHHFKWGGTVGDALTWERVSIVNRFDIKCIAFSPQKWDKHSASTKFLFLHRNSVGLTPSAAPAAIPARTKHKN